MLWRRRAWTCPDFPTWIADVSCGIRDPISSAASTDDALRLKEAEARLRLALQAASIGIWQFDVATGELVWDTRVREVVEADPDGIPTWAEHFLPAVHADDLDRVQQAFAAAVETEGGDLSVDFRIIGSRSGKITWASLIGQKADGPAGVRLVGTARDITAERTGMQLLRDRSHTLQARVDEALAERHPSKTAIDHDRR